MNWFIIAAIADFAVAALHLVIIFFLGAEGYRTFGAGENMAVMAEQGRLYPHVITFGITIVFTLFGFYALSGAEIIRQLPLLKWGLITISAIYIIRGLGGIPIYLSGYEDQPLMIWSSIVSFSIGLFHVLGIHASWTMLNKL